MSYIVLTLFGWTGGGEVIFAHGRNFYNNSKKNKAIITKLFDD